MISPVITLILNLVLVVFSIVVLIKIGKNAWGMVRGYGIFCLILNILSCLMTLIGLVLYLVVVGVIGSAVQTHGNDSNVTGAVVGFALIIAIIPYSIACLLYTSPSPRDS